MLRNSSAALAVSEMVWLVVPLLVDVVSATCRTIEVPVGVVAVSVVPVVQLAMVSPPAKNEGGEREGLFSRICYSWG